MLRQTGVDGVTAARGAIGNPWIFAQARALAAGLPLPEPPTVHEPRLVETADPAGLDPRWESLRTLYATRAPSFLAVR